MGLRATQLGHAETETRAGFPHRGTGAPGVPKLKAEGTTGWGQRESIQGARRPSNAVTGGGAKKGKKTAKGTSG